MVALRCGKSILGSRESVVLSFGIASSLGQCLEGFTNLVRPVDERAQPTIEARDPEVELVEVGRRRLRGSRERRDLRTRLRKRRGHLVAGAKDNADDVFSVHRSDVLDVGNQKIGYFTGIAG